MRWLIGFAALAVLAVTVLSLYVRLAPLDGRGAHVSPYAVSAPETPNWALAAPADGAPTTAPRTHDAPVFDGVSEDEIAARVDRILTQEMGAERVVAERYGPRPWNTYLVRSPLMGFPDFVTVLTADLEDGRTSVLIYSRSVYGRSDLGANAERVERLIERLRAGDGVAG